MLVTLHKIDVVHFCLLGANGFHIKAKKKKIYCCELALSSEISRRRLADYVKTLHQLKSVLHVQHNYFSSFNQSNHWFVAFSLTLPSSKYEISRRRLADYVKTYHQKACRACSTIIFLHSTNQIIDLRRCRWRCRRQIWNSLISFGVGDGNGRNLIGGVRKNKSAARAARTLK